ncbi:MAG TPA: tetratricopeptide repeat protein [Bryobacteraceae bacterium]|nr:tetratricopeptide repeat protein [Bryobacteraceae bacterium]
MAQSLLDRGELFDELTFHAVVKAALADPAVQQELANLPAADDDALKLYLSGKLSAPAGRALAQAALENDELFDQLAAHGAVEQSLNNPEVRSALSAAGGPRATLLQFPRRSRAIAIGSIAAALALIAVYAVRTRVWPENKPVASTHPTAPVAPAVRTLIPGLDLTSGRPVLLARDLTARSDAAPVFRSSTPDSRTPRASGSIVAIDNFEAIVNLGSLDGLAKGVELDVFRGDGKGPSIGRMVVTTVFRERARARIVPGESIRENDRVSAGATVYLGAVLQQVNAFADSGDFAEAREAARNAIAWADSNGAAGGPERKILERLGALDYQAGDAVAAEEHYRSAVATFSAPQAASASEQAAILNALGVVYLLRGDDTQAEARLSEAREKSEPGEVQGHILNNLGVLAELRGDIGRAQTLYSDALRAFQTTSGISSRDRQAAETNLARLATRVDEKH